MIKCAEVEGTFTDQLYSAGVEFSGIGAIICTLFKG